MQLNLIAFFSDEVTRAADETVGQRAEITLKLKFELKHTGTVVF